MKISSINQINNTNFKMKFHLSDETLNSISKSTKLSKEELHRLPMDEALKVMKERGAIKEPSKLKQWISEKYKAFGEKMGLLQKQYNFYSEID